jgi:hypothetical protein
VSFVVNHQSSRICRFEEVLRKTLQHTTRPVHRDLFGGIQVTGI